MATPDDRSGLNRSAASPAARAAPGTAPDVAPEAAKPIDPRPGGSMPRGLRIEQALAATAMALLCLITFANVLVRYFTSLSFAWTEEISVFLMVFMTLIGASSALALDRHIRITLVPDRVGPAARRLLSLFAALCTLFMFGLLTAYGLRFARDDWEFEVTTPALDIPQWLYSVWLPVLAGLITLRALVALVSLVRSDAHGGEGR